jgi:hypothetical protein
VLGWHKRCKLAHAFLWEHSYRRLQLAQLLGQLGVFLTFTSGHLTLAAMLGPSFSGTTGTTRSSFDIWYSPRVRSHRRFRNRDTEYVGDSGIKRMSSTTRQGDRALYAPQVSRWAL